MDFMLGRSRPKNGPRFVRLTGRPLCFPIVGDDPETAEVQLGLPERYLQMYKKLGEWGMNGQQTYHFLAIGFVHRSRLGSRLEVVSAEALRKSLGSPPVGPGASA